MNVLDEILPEAGAFYVLDRGYLDFERLYRFTMSAAFFVTRAKTNVRLQRRYSRAVDKSTGVQSDQTVILTAIGSARVYPDALRRIVYRDAETNKRLTFLTNNFDLPALTIALILQVPLAGGTFLQMDQAAPPDQGFLRHQRKCGEDTDLDRRVRLRARCYRSQKARTELKSLSDSTDSQHHAF